MQSPMTFKDRLLVLGIVSVICAAFVLLNQIPFFNEVFEKVAGFMQTEFVSSRGIYSD